MSVALATFLITLLALDVFVEAVLPFGQGFVHRPLDWMIRTLSM